MKLPIIADNRGDVLVFNSINSAECYLEPIDVRNGEYEVFDSNGALIKATVWQDPNGIDRTKLIHDQDETTPPDAAKLREKLISYLAEVGECLPEDVSLGEMIAKVSAYSGVE